jgi:hypothetical protein
VARSPRRNCSTMKMMINIAKPSKHPHTLEFFHGYVDPPHCSAKSKQTIEQMRKSAPSRSISKIFCFKVNPEDLRLGGLKKRKTTAIAIAPNGRLIYTVSDVPCIP